MKEDERQMLLAFYRMGGRYPVCPRDIAKELGIHPKRAYRLCEKWGRKGWYDWGVAADLGWLTDKGYEFGATLEHVEENFTH